MGGGRPAAALSPPTLCWHPVKEQTLSHVLNQVEDGVMRLTLNRPEKKNALTVAMYQDLTAGLRQAHKDPAVRVVLVSGAKDVFAAGNDLVDFMKTPPTGMDSPVVQFLVALSELPKPIICAVAGPAIGIGTTMLLHADLVYADDSARFRMPFVNLGLCPEGASSYLLPRLMGRPRASELLFFGEDFSASRALELGLLTAVVPTGKLAGFAWDRAVRLARQPPNSLRATKDLLRRHTVEQIKAALKQEGDVFAERVRSDEAMEAFSAFFEKRTPDFSRFE